MTTFLRPQRLSDLPTPRLQQRLSLEESTHGPRSPITDQIRAVLAAREAADQVRRNHPQPNPTPR